jgi:hypothetical protein
MIKTPIKRTAGWQGTERESPLRFPVYFTGALLDAKVTTTLVISRSGSCGKQAGRSLIKRRKLRNNIGCPKEVVLRRMPSAAYLSVLSRDSSFVLSFLPNPKSRRSDERNKKFLF